MQEIYTRASVFFCLLVATMALWEVSGADTLAVQARAGGIDTYIIVMDSSLSLSDSAKTRRQKLGIVQDAAKSVLENIPSDAKIGFFPAGCYVEGGHDNASLRAADGVPLGCYKSLNSTFKALKLGFRSLKQERKLNVNPALQAQKQIQNRINQVPDDLLIFTDAAVSNVLDGLQETNYSAGDNVYLIFLRLSLDNQLHISQTKLNRFAEIRRSEYDRGMRRYHQGSKWGNNSGAPDIESMARDFYACIEKRATSALDEQPLACDFYALHSTTWYLSVTPHLDKNTLARLVSKQPTIDKKLAGRVIEAGDIQATTVLVEHLGSLQSKGNQSLKQIVAEEIDLEELPVYQP